MYTLANHPRDILYRHTENPFIIQLSIKEIKMKNKKNTHTVPYAIYRN